MSPVERSRDTLLAGGPKYSLHVAETLASQGITAKQLRRARGNLGVVVTRSGCGQDMQSTWGLPIETAEAPEPGDGEAIHAHREVLREGQIFDNGGSGVSQGDGGNTVHLQPFEEDRIARRVPLFICKGLDPWTAKHVAMLLTIERDRPGVRGGSCVECQNWIGPRACIPADAWFGQGPRDASEVLFCGYARLSTPDMQLAERPSAVARPGWSVRFHDAGFKCGFHPMGRGPLLRYNHGHEWANSGTLQRPCPL